MRCTKYQKKKEVSVFKCCPNLCCQQEDHAIQQSSAETVGRELERQLLFGEHAGSTRAADVASTTSASAPSRIQAGCVVVNLGDSTPDGNAPTAPPAILGETVRALEGAAWAHRATTAPLVVVCSQFVRWPCVESALAIVTAHWEDEPTAKKRVIVAGMHGGVSQALRGQVAMLRKGVVLCFDCFGRTEWLPGPEYYPSDEESAVRIAELTRQGFADRIVISQGVSRRIHLSRYVAIA